MAFLHEFRFGVRSLVRRNPGTTIVAVMTLALGIGANTAIFSVIDGVLLKPLPYPDSDRMVQLHATHRDFPEADSEFFSGPNFLSYRETLDSFEWLACLYIYSPEGFNLDLGGRALRISRLKVSEGYFETLGVNPQLGRTFERDDELSEEDPGYAPARPLAILSHQLWQSYFAGDREVLGKPIRLSGTNYTVIGVMPRGLQDPLVGRVDVWVPQNLSPGGYNNPYNSYISILGRLKPGVSPESAQSELNALTIALEDQHEANQGRRARILPLQEKLVGDLDRVLYLLLGTVGLLLLIACVNVANLLLARYAARKRELAIRSALGLSRLGMTRQLFTESLLLAVTGALAGFALAWLGVKTLLALRPESLPAVSAIGLDSGVLGFTCLVAVATALLFGLAPAWFASGISLEEALRQGSRGVAGGGHRATRILVVCQVALSLVLLSGAGLLAKSFLALLNIETGFSSKNAYTYRIDLPDAEYGPWERERFYRQLHDRLTLLPGIEASGSISKLPLDGPLHNWGIRIPELPQDDERARASAQIRCVDGMYFQALGIPLLKGRYLGREDRQDTQAVIVVSDELVRSSLSDEEVLGRQLLVAGQPRTIVGVVGGVRHEHLLPVRPTVYIPHSQFADNRNWKLFQVVATTSPRPDIFNLIRQEVSQMDRSVAVFRTNTMSEIASGGISQQRFATTLMVVFAGLALLLAAVGLYGVLSQSVGQRRREFGVRMALGAQRSQVLGLVLRDGLMVALLGVVVGALGAALAGRWLESMLYEVRSTDPWVFLLVLLFIAVTAIVAGLIPARKATLLSPSEVLREE